MLTAMLRALGHDRIEATSYNALGHPPTGRPGLVLLGVDPIEPEPRQVLCGLCRADNAPPFILLFTAAPPQSLRPEFRTRATAVLRFPLPASQLGAAVALALDAAGVDASPAWAGRSQAPNHEFPRPAPLPPARSSPFERRPADGRWRVSPAWFSKPDSPATTEGRIRPLKESLEGPERALILQALRACQWNRNETADVLKICRSTLYHKMRQYKLFDVVSD
jgi:hypothetical protein